MHLFYNLITYGYHDNAKALLLGKSFNEKNARKLEDGSVCIMFKARVVKIMDKNFANGKEKSAFKRK